MSSLICLDVNIRTYLVRLTQDLSELLENTVLEKSAHQFLVSEIRHGLLYK